VCRRLSCRGRTAADANAICPIIEPGIVGIRSGGDKPGRREIAHRAIEGSVIAVDAVTDSTAAKRAGFDGHCSL
jgi:hypothetical protein